MAQQAAPCSGTLCDLYYRNSGNASAAAAGAQPSVPGAPPGATPMTVPSGNFFTGLFSRNSAEQQGGQTAGGQPAPSQSSYIPGVRMGGGGLLGDHSQAQCEGTLCDLTGRSTPPREQVPAASQQVATEAAQAQPQAGSVAYAPTKHYDPIVEKPRCHNATDPWHCYR